MTYIPTVEIISDWFDINRYSDLEVFSSSYLSIQKLYYFITTKCVPKCQWNPFQQAGKTPHFNPILKYTQVDYSNSVKGGTNITDIITKEMDTSVLFNVIFSSHMLTNIGDLFKNCQDEQPIQATLG